MSGSAAARTTPVGDEAERRAAILEKSRNVLIDAGAGTGKTSILVARIVELVAPEDDAQPALTIDRLVAVTFTRRAAGELRLRAREELLRALAASPSPVRQARLRAAMTGLETAHLGTIHSVADRLLRVRPAEANISPTYEICEDIGALVDETTAALVRGAERGELARYLPASARELQGRAAEAEETIDLYLRADLRQREWVHHYAVHAGLDSVVWAFVESRDQPPVDPPLQAPDLRAFIDAACAFADEAAALPGQTIGSQWLRDRALRVRALLVEGDPAALLTSLRLLFGHKPAYTMGEHFSGDREAWALWKKLWDGVATSKPKVMGKVKGKGQGKAVQPAAPAYVDAMKAPLERWLSCRIVRLFPVVMALHEAAKRRARAVDHLDLLLKLRDLLRDDPMVRSAYQEMFDHLLVDEFQDTDPLQAEVLLYLAAKPGVRIDDVWTDAPPVPGKITLVGDPKQSIYRFRRADIAAYDRVWQVVRQGGPLEVRLAFNFRSRPELVDFANDRFDGLLGRAPTPGQLFDTVAGSVFHQPLEPGRNPEPADAGKAVHVLTLQAAPGGRTNAEDLREIEGRALAAYLRWLKEKSGLTIADPLDRRRRPIEFGDIAVLAFSTFTLPSLFGPLDAMGVPYSSRGGTLFLADAVHRQFLLGLRALADSKDGVAMAALMRPPFFAVDPMDLLLEQIASHDPATGQTASEDPRVTRVQEARAVVKELRRHRFDRSPGTTARELLEQTGFGRMVALGANGAQRLERLRELCVQIDRQAADGGLDFDAVTALTRGWVDHPVHLDPPHPVGADAVQVLTVHQAKGLEWPVVVLWDGCALLDDRERPLVWKTDRSGQAWTFQVKGLDWEEPPDAGIKQREQVFEIAQRKRLVYVAGTRARDLLVIAHPGKGPKTISGRLLEGAPEMLVEQLPAWVDGAGAAWSAGIVAPAPTASGELRDDGALGETLASRWRGALAAASAPRLAPSGITTAAHRERATIDADSPAPARQGRFGPVFGETVHLAIGIVLRSEATAGAAAVDLAARATGLDHHLPDAAADVDRTVEALRGLGVAAPIGPHVRLEYPLAAATADGAALLAGYADLVIARPDELVVVDFKSDAPPTADVSITHAAYVQQVRSYARLLGGPLPTRAALLFTADGHLRWVSLPTT